MKIPAIRAKIGTWTYYQSKLTFEQVNSFVEKIDDQLHKSHGLRDLIQRSITDNYLGIKEYIVNQPEMFFNSLVLGVYDGMPQWIEVEINFSDEEFFDLGFLEFPGNQKIFPIDGQHRVEGIKEAILENEELKGNEIGVIFIGHSKDDAGMEKSRRLFTTLNRYAKPVTMDDIIALDEDDSVAICTRYLLENFDLFSEKKVTKSKSKAIPDRDKDSITSIITLYQCNKELLKLFRRNRKISNPKPERDNKSITSYLKFRPDENEIYLYREFLIQFWTLIKDNIDHINEFIAIEDKNPAVNFRNKETGGSLLFRPVGLLPFIQAIITINIRTNQRLSEIISNFNNLNFQLNEIPWKNVMWNPNEKTMIMGNQLTVKLLLMYVYSADILTDNEQLTLQEKYADNISWQQENLNRVLQDIPKLQ